MKNRSAARASRRLRHCCPRSPLTRVGATTPYYIFPPGASSAATPATPWDVDADFITRALREAELLPDGVDVAAISIEPLSLQGFISDVARCRVTYSSRDAGGATPMPGEGTGSLGTLPPSLIVKTCASNDESYAAGRECDAYKTEAVFFKNLARVVSVGSPECLLVSSDGPGERYCYVMEDLDLRPDIYYVPQSLGAGEKECRAVAKGLAELHAPRWRWERPLPAWLPAMTEHPLRNPARVFSEWWESFSSSTYFTELPEPSRLAHERCQRRAEQLAAALSSGPRTLLHCDARSDNLFFGDRTAPGGVVFLDWQLICQGIGVFDLAWFMCTSAVHGTPGEERDRPIVEAYWEALTSHPSGRVSKARYTLEAAWRDYQLGAATTMAVFSCAPKFLSDAIRSEKPKEYEQLAEMIGRSAAVVAAIGADTVPYERLVH